MPSPTPSAPDAAPVTDQPTSWQHLSGLAVGLSLLVTLVLLAFSWPATVAEPRDLPLAVVGQQEQVEAMGGTLAQSAPGVFSVEAATDRAAAVRMIEEREVYGAVVMAPAPEVLVSSAANVAVSQVLAGLAAPLQAMAPPAAADAAAEPVAVEVTDVVPLSEDDPRGTGLSAAALPIVIGGMLGGVVTSLVVRGASRRIVGLVGYSVLSGGAMTLVLGPWFGFLPSNPVGIWAVFALTVLSISSCIAGLASLVGRAGIAVGALTFLLLGNPLSGVALPKEFLPGPWGEIGQLLPPGAGSTLLRLVSYFPEASTLQPWLVLTAWTALGLALLLIGHRRTVVASVPS